MTLSVPELNYKYLHFKIPRSQPVSLSWRGEGNRGGGRGVPACPHLNKTDFAVIKPWLL